MKSIALEEINPDILYVTSWQSTKEPKTDANKVCSTYRILYFKRGSGRFETNGGNFMCKKNEAVILPPLTNYSTSAIEKGSIIINVSYDLVKSRKLESSKINQTMFRSLNNHYIPSQFASERFIISNAPALNAPLHIKNFIPLGNIIGELHLEYRNMKRFYKLRISSILTELLVNTARMTEQGNSPKSSDIADRILNYVNENHKEKLSCRTIAEHFNYHPNHVTRIIKKSTGMTLYKYITETKIRYATYMLLNTDYSVTYIAHELSFNDCSHFCNVYYAATGMQPSEARKYRSAGQVVSCE
jgi:AraC-like DNA-binding protein